MTKCKYCGWMNHLFRVKCRHCHKPMPTNKYNVPGGKR